VADKSKRPGDAELAASLGPAKKHWDEFLERIRTEHPSAIAEWKHYSTGWRLVVKGQRRNLAYLNPSQERFTVAFAFSDEAVKAAEESDLPAAIVKPMRESKKFPEGRAVRIDVASARDAAHAAKLFAIKIAH
jgi:hypothetical protein